MNTKLIFLVLLFGLFATDAGAAENFEWLVRVSSTNTSVSGPQGGFALSGGGGTQFEIASRYKLGDDLAVEASIAPGAKEELDFFGSSLGEQSVIRLPVGVLYKFPTANGRMSPYAGGGIQYTQRSGDYSVGGTKLNTDSSPFGMFATAGVDMKMSNGISFNIQARYAPEKTTVHLPGGLEVSSSSSFTIGMGIQFKF